MDCSVFFLSHNDLRSTNVTLDGKQVMVLDLELAGYASHAIGVNQVWHLRRLLCGACQQRRRRA